MAPRQGILLALLVATLTAVWWGGREEVAGEAGDVVQVAKRDRPAVPAASGPGPAQAAAGGPTPPRRSAPVSAASAPVRLSASGADLFPPQSWRPPPPPPVVVPPPAPQAPPVPFKYLGRWREDGADIVFLAEGERTRPVRAGDRLGSWRVDTIGEQALTLTYLPLEQTRTLRLTP